MSVAHHDRLRLDHTDFTTVRPLIRTRLYSTAAIGPDVVRRVVAPGLIQRVVVDRDGAVTPVTFDMLRSWPIGEFELFTLAEHNVRAAGGVRIRHGEFDIPLAAGLPPMSILSGPEYLTAHARWLGDHPVTGPHGAVLILPSEQHIYAYPIVGPELAAAATVLAQLARVCHAEDDHPLNPWVYWWHNGTLDLAATTTHRNGETDLEPTDRFRHFATLLSEEPTG